MMTISTKFQLNLNHNMHMFMGKCIWKYNWSLITFFNAKQIENAIFFIMIIPYMSTFKKFCITKLDIAGGPITFIK